jgi:hypothetical protein
MLVGVLSAVFLPVLSAGAAEETTDTTVASTETTVAEGETVVTKAPAVEVVDEAPAEELAPWTIRYLIPTSLVIAGVLVFVTVVQYFLKVVRTRYKTVE